MKTRNLFWLSAALLMAACTNEEDISMASSSAIQFNAAISESRVILGYSVQCRYFGKPRNWQCLGKGG